jgi:protein TonB
VLIKRNAKILAVAAGAILLCLGTSLRASQQERPSAEQQPPLPTRVRVSQAVMAAFLIKKVPPEYPEEAHKKRIQGTVVLHGVISNEGDVAEVAVVSGDPMFTQAAIDAVKQWKYKPYRLNGRPVEVETQFQLNFVLSGN